MCQKNNYARRTVKVMLAVITALFAFGATLNAQVASATPYTLEQSVIASGGGTSESAGNTFSITGTIGQSVAGTTSTNSPYSVKGGFFTPNSFAPTAGGVTVSGRVRRAGGKGIKNVLVTLTELNGTTRSTLSDDSGAYSFTDVEVGQSVVITALAKRFSFMQPTQVLNLLEETLEIDFIVFEQFSPLETPPK